METWKTVPPLTSRQTRGELIFALCYLPVHVAVLPRLLFWLGVPGEYREFVRYALGAVIMLAAERGFFRRDFDPLCERPGFCILQVLSCYLSLLCFNLFVGSILALVTGLESSNPNNEAVMALSDKNYGATAAMAVFLAPLVEECIFRGAVFGGLRRISRGWALAVSVLSFALYHLWGYAVSEPGYFIYLMQYLPAGYLLCRCYEYTDSIWGSVFLHMLVNGVSFAALNAVG